MLQLRRDVYHGLNHYPTASEGTEPQTYGPNSTGLAASLYS